MNRTKYVLSALCILVLMCLMPCEALAQTNTIKGTVSSADGPVIGATVKVKGSSNGVVTDLDGNYTIKAKPGDEHSVSNLAKETKDVNGGTH